MAVLDINGVELKENDIVVTTKDLTVGPTTIKQGEKYKKIRFIDNDDEHMKCGKFAIKGCFLKKVKK